MSLVYNILSLCDCDILLTTSMAHQAYVPPVPRADQSHIQNGALILVIGPMFSGKTSFLHHMFDKYTRSGRDCVMVTHQSDVRYDESGDETTYSRTHNKNKIPCVRTLNDPSIDNHDVVLVDEVQFFENGDVAVDKLAMSGKIVICGGLSGDFKRQPFPVVSSLIAKADEIIHLKAICYQTGKEAPFSQKTKVTENDSQIEIGGAELYQPVSRQAYVCA